MIIHLNSYAETAYLPWIRFKKIYAVIREITIKKPRKRKNNPMVTGSIEEELRNNASGRIIISTKKTIWTMKYFFRYPLMKSNTSRKEWFRHHKENPKSFFPISFFKSINRSETASRIIAIVSLVAYTTCCKREDALYPTVNCKQRGTGHESKRYRTKLSYR
jgi:hypothetical protein